LAPPGNNSNDSKKVEELQKKIEEQTKISEDQANTIARLENDIKKLGDVNASPRIIQRGNQKHPKYVSNNDKISATIAKEIPKAKPIEKPKKE